MDGGPQDLLFDGGRRVEISEIQAALVEWYEPLMTVRRIEAGMITMSLSEYREIPVAFMAVWDLYRKEKYEYEKEQAEKRKKLLNKK